MDEFCKKVVDNKNVVIGVFVVIMVLLTLIVMQLYKIGYYKEKLGNRGLEIPPDYIPGTDFSEAVIPNQFVGNSTGGITSGAAMRFGQENTSGTASNGSGRTYVYSTRLDDKVRTYNDAINQTYATAHDLSAQTGGLKR